MYRALRAPATRRSRHDPASAGDKYVRWLARTGYAESTREAYARQVERYLAWLVEHTPTYDGALGDPHVASYAARDYRRRLLDARASTSAITQWRAALVSLYDWLGAPAPRLPAEPATPAPDPRALGDDALRSVLRAAERAGPQEHALLALLAFTGPRASEVIGLDTCDVEVHARMGDVTYLGKGDQRRTVPLPAAARDALRPWLPTRGYSPDPGTPVFVAASGQRMPRRTLGNLVGRVGRAAGLDHLHPHVLRHTFATRHIAAGTPSRQVQAWLGHASSRTTDRYTTPRAAESRTRIENAHLDT